MSKFDSLSDVQRKIVFEKKGKFVVRACPGSGKTYSVAARLARILETWDRKHQGIAIISFTNAAWQEIRRQVETHFDIPFGVTYPHFLGTIDSFINQHIFLPFGHIALKCSKRPEMVGEPFGLWHGKTFSESKFDKISIGINGDFYALDIRSLPKDWKLPKYFIVQAKKKLLRLGFATQRDADFYAMKLLKEIPAIAKALTYKYPLLIIDEAQDTSDIQMRIIDTLIENGLNEIMLVGDPDQAIFEWNEAKPKLFEEKYETWKDNSIILNENRRSSQKICDCTYKFSTLSEASIAISEGIKDCPFTPMILTYTQENIGSIVDSFLSLCEVNKIDVNHENVAVLARSREFLKLVAGIPTAKNEPWQEEDLYTKDFAKGKYLSEKGEIKKGFSLIEKAYLKAVMGKSVCTQEDINKKVDELGFSDYRKDIFRIFSLLPQTTMNIRDWVSLANERFRTQSINIVLSIKKRAENVGFDQIFGSEHISQDAKPYYLGTVHSVKGETFEAVLLFLKQRAASNAYYKALLQKGTSIKDNEELRIIYVALTRPRKLLVLAVPDKEDKIAWESRLLS